MTLVYRGPDDKRVVRWFGGGPDAGATYTFEKDKPQEVSEELAVWALDQDSRGCTDMDEARDYQMQVYEVLDGGEA